MSGMLLVSIDMVILSDGACNIVSVGLAYERKGKARLATKLGLAAIGVQWRLLGVQVGRLDALEPRLPLRRRHAAEAIVQETYVPLTILGEPMLARRSIHRVVQYDMVRTIRVGLATSRECTSIKGAEQLVPGSIQVMGTGAFSVAHVSNHMN